LVIRRILDLPFAAEKRQADRIVRNMPRSLFSQLKSGSGRKPTMTMFARLLARPARPAEALSRQAGAWRFFHALGSFARTKKNRRSFGAAVGRGGGASDPLPETLIVRVTDRG
jgi:hypothetical protein